MKSLRRIFAASAFVPYALLLARHSPSAPPNFSRDVAPILRAHCASCHSGSDPAGGLDLSTIKGLTKGGNSGLLYVPGNSKTSLLLQRILGAGKGDRMPMGQPALADGDIQTIRRWIEAGASLGGATTEQHWAYVCPKLPKLPAVSDMKWVRNPIDRFVLAKLESKGLRPSPEASKESLIRRVSLDLTGLPPTLGELDAFLADKSPNAYEKVVDRLLASPHYGERQARVWLDLSRYADTDGYEKDLGRTAYLYRDWLIDAFNRNMPYDEFTIEQLAGDLLPNPTTSQLIATGFHRNTMQNLEGGVDQAEAHFNVVLDRVDTTATVWLGSTLACARCHDHKYDPFTQRDYYKMSAFFSNTVVHPEGPKEIGEEKWREPILPVPTDAQKIEEIRLTAEIKDLEREDAEKPSANSKARLQKAKGALESLQSAIPTALILREDPENKFPFAYVHHRGEFLSPTERVLAGVPTLFGAGFATPPNRLDLARWLMSDKNPLTARVQVNRVWEEYFGRGIVETSEDFGTRGSPPTHPELLDWLACEFRTHRWDMKYVSRMIVTSATYRQSSNATDVDMERDPQDLFLEHAPRFRMEAEMIHDTALAASGLLSLKVGGPSVFPDQPNGVWDSPYSGETWKSSRGQDAFRRGLYTYWKRTAPYPAFMTLDATSREACTVRRIRTNTPLQALAMLNDRLMLTAGGALGDRMAARKNVTEGLTLGFRLCTSRVPNQRELDRLKTLYDRLQKRYQADNYSALTLGGVRRATWTMVGNVLLNLDETITKG